MRPPQLQKRNDRNNSPPLFEACNLDPVVGGKFLRPDARRKRRHRRGEEPGEPLKRTTHRILLTEQYYRRKHRCLLDVRPTLHCIFDRIQKLLVVEWLAKIRGRARGKTLFPGPGFVVCGDDDSRKAGAGKVVIPLHVETGHIGHMQVQYQAIVSTQGQGVEELPAGREYPRVKAPGAKQPRKCFTDRRFVIHDGNNC
jgi:hypothetical protein